MTMQPISLSNRPVYLDGPASTGCPSPTSVEAVRQLAERVLSQNRPAGRPLPTAAPSGLFTASAASPLSGPPPQSTSAAVSTRPPRPMTAFPGNRRLVPEEDASFFASPPNADTAMGSADPLTSPPNAGTTTADPMNDSQITESLPSSPNSSRPSSRCEEIAEQWFTANVHYRDGERPKGSSWHVPPDTAASPSSKLKTKRK